MNEKLTSTIDELTAITEEVRAAFGGLSAEQVNWKPSEKSWSVGQCLDHLIKTNSCYFPLFEQLAKGEHKPSALERLSPLSGFFGRFLIKALDPDNQKKLKAAAKATPGSSDVPADIVDVFGKNQNELAERISRLPEGLNLEKTIITSPLAGFVTYSLADALRIITVHERRHFGQAVRVTESPEFPR